MTSSSPPQQPAAPPIEDLDWEEWDSTTGLSFTHHCLAGSFAGVAEHTLLYPLDTVKTCWQSQVLHRAAGGGGNVAGCDPCSVHQTVNKLKPATPSVVNSQSSAAAAAAFHSTGSASQQQQQQSIWSTMKHLMRHGSHHQGGHSHHPAQLSHHAHVTTLATTSAPNVVDLTTNNNGAEHSLKVTNHPSSSSLQSSNSGSGGKKQRPWSKSARIVRGATLNDIAPSLQPSLYHTNGSGGASSSLSMTTTSSSSSSSLSSTVKNSLGNGTTTTTNNNTGFKRLWRGVQTMFVGCIPAHALYFSSYESIKSICLDHNHNNNNSNNNNGKETSQQHHVGIDTLSPLQAMAAGGVATLLHDFIMTPMDTMKQRHGPASLTFWSIGDLFIAKIFSMSSTKHHGGVCPIAGTERPISKINYTLLLIINVRKPISI